MPSFLQVPARETFPLLPVGTPLLMYLVLIPFATVLFYGIYVRVRPYGLRNVFSEFKQHPSLRLRQLLDYAFLQSKVSGKTYAAIMHLMIYVGTFILFVGTSLVFIDYDILSFFNLSILRGTFYQLFEVSLDTFGILFIVGLVVALSRRTILRPSYLENKREYFTILGALLFLGFTGYLLEGMRLALKPVPYASWSYVGSTMAQLLQTYSNSPLTLASVYPLLWWSHALVTFALVSSIPYTSLGHILVSSLNAMIASPRLQGAMSTPFNLMQLSESGQFDVRVGVRTTDDLNWKQKLALDACTNCGRCEAACPATAAGTPLSPRLIVQKLRSQLFVRDGFSRELVPEIVTEEEIWACTFCGACIQACPVLINPLEYIAEIKREVVATATLDRKKTDLLQNLTQAFNPYGLPQGSRESFVLARRLPKVSEVPDAEYLYWIGCAGYFDGRCSSIVDALVKIMRAAGVSFAVLGAEERCNGDPARRLGEEGRFQELAFQNIETLKKYGSKKIVVHCPHCYNTLRNEYRQLGANFEVIHHTQLVFDLIKAGKIELRADVKEKITLHDACYVGRFNGIFEEPRKTLLEVKGVELREMERIRERSFCCGGGGANYWYDVAQEEKISVIRSKEAARTGARILATECPFCLQMLEDGVKTAGLDTGLRVRDVAEIIAETL